MTRAFGFRWGLMLVAGLLTLAGQAAEFTDPVKAALAPLPPAPNGLSDLPLVVRPPESRPPTPSLTGGGGALPDPILRSPMAGRTRGAPPSPGVEFEYDSRVLLLGELFAEEHPLGYLETRLSSQWPEREVRFRNLGWPATGLIALEQDGKPGSELDRLLRAAGTFQPTTVCVSLGREDAGIELAERADFRAAYERLLDRLSALVPEAPPKLVVFSPTAYEPAPSATRDAREANERLSSFILETLHAATNRNLPFLNLFGFSLNDSEIGRRKATEQQTTLRYYTEDGSRLNAYGLWRLTFGMERALRWPANNWRFGYMADNRFRDGGFGIDLRSRSRSARAATLKVLLQRLPTPNPSGLVDRQEDTKPQCYVQISGFDPGLYELRIDDAPVATGTHEDWARYRIIAEGPDWTQAEALRQAIVAKNEIVGRWLRAFDAADQRAALEAEIAAAEARIFELRKPVERTLTVRRTGDAPAPTSP